MNKKTCTNCKRELEVRIETFQKHGSNPDGLQPWCRECDHWYKAFDLRQGWNRLRSQALEEGVFSEWTEEDYRRILWSCGSMVVRRYGQLAIPVCFWCENRVNAWTRATAVSGGGGFWLDRIDNNRDHTPDNCVPVCIPCNTERCRMVSHEWRRQIDAKKAEFLRAGFKFIMWDRDHAGAKQGWKEAWPVDLSGFVVRSPHEQLLLAGAL